MSMMPGKPSSCSHKISTYPVQYDGEWVGDPVIHKVADPNHFNITRVRQVGKFVIAEIKYPNCTNYEGKKILVYKDADQEEIFRERRLDPHFCKNSSCRSPIARFEPTARGWEMAIYFCTNWGKYEKIHLTE